MRDSEQQLLDNDRAQGAILYPLISAGALLIAIGIILSVGPNNDGLIITAFGFGLMLFAVAVGHIGSVLAGKLGSDER